MKRIWLLASILFFTAVLVSFFPGVFGLSTTYSRNGLSAPDILSEKKEEKPVLPPLDHELYDRLLQVLANNPPPPPVTTPPLAPLLNQGGEGGGDSRPALVYKWPVKTEYPRDGAILPFKRVVAYYGNLYSTKMGVLGQYPETEMLSRLAVEVKKWEVADPTTPVQPALHYIAVVAQGSEGVDGKYRARMPDSEIDKVLAIAEKIPARKSYASDVAGGNAIVFLDIQVGFSTVESEIPLLEKYLKLPNVHLGVDPEFSMKSGIRPGKVVGTVDATDINFATNYLAKIVRENDLPPKILVVHRYTQKMVTNYQNIKILPEVQIVMHMDGWGPQAKKIGTYKQFIYPEPVQFTGFKLFYKNDTLEPGTSIFEPSELLKLNPRPIYIQYQ